MNSFVSLSTTGSTVNELSVIRCNASSTDSLELALGVVWRSTPARSVRSHSLRGRYRSMLNDTIPARLPWLTTT